MSAKYKIRNNVETLDYAPEFKPYTRVIINCGEDEDGNALIYTAGDDSGQTLETSIPLIAPFREGQSVPAAGQEMAQRILEQIQGYKYQPFDGQNALIPDEADLGDALLMGGIYGAMIGQDLDIDFMPTSNVVAPDANESDNEFGSDYISREQRELARKLNKIASSFTMTARKIESKIEGIDGQLNTITQTLNEQGGAIEMVVSDGKVKASAIISAINEESTATINANRIELNGDLVINAINGGTGNVSINANRVNMSGVLTWDNISGRPNMSNYVTDSEFSSTVSSIYTTIDETSVTAEKLIGREVKLIDRVKEYGELVDHDVGSLVLTYTENYDLGVELNADMGLKLTSKKNVFIDAGSSGSITMKEGNIIFSKMNFCIPGQGYGWGYDSPLGKVNGVNNQVYFQVVD